MRQGVRELSQELWRRRIAEDLRAIGYVERLQVNAAQWAARGVPRGKGGHGAGGWGIDNDVYVGSIGADDRCGSRIGDHRDGGTPIFNTRAMPAAELDLNCQPILLA